MLLDLGVSSMQLDTAGRGFSFLKEAPLDMRFDERQSVTAARLLDTLDQKRLAQILRDYGEEPRANQIADAIIRNRPFRTTTQLAELVLAVYHGQRGKIHPATRTFQALRMATNSELERLSKGLAQGIQALRRAAGWRSSAFTRWKTAWSNSFSSAKAAIAFVRRNRSFALAGIKRPSG
jgi:16S rRNA (cytosine1402-N4)-methyltransferase